MGAEIPYGTTTTLRVPADFASVSAALSSLAGVTVLGQAQVQIADGTYSMAGTTSLNHPDGQNIQLLGNPGNPAACVLQSTTPGVDLFQVTNGNNFGLVSGFTFTLPTKAGENAPAAAVNIQDGSASIANCVANNWFYGYISDHNSTLSLVNCTGTNNGFAAFLATDGGEIHCTFCTATNAHDTDNGEGFGFYATEGGVISANYCTATNCFDAGFAATTNGTGRYLNCTADHNVGGLGAGFFAEAEGTMDAAGSTSKNQLYGYYAQTGGSFYTIPADGGGNTNRVNSYIYYPASSADGQVATTGGNLNLIAPGDIKLMPSAGNVRFGTYTAGATSVIGYITIKDSLGTLRKLAVIS